MECFLDEDLFLADLPPFLLDRRLLVLRVPLLTKNTVGIIIPVWVLLFPPAEPYFEGSLTAAITLVPATACCWDGLPYTYSAYDAAPPPPRVLLRLPPTLGCGAGVGVGVVSIIFLIVSVIYILFSYFYYSSLVNISCKSLNALCCQQKSQSSSPRFLFFTKYIQNI